MIWNAMNMRSYNILYNIYITMKKVIAWLWIAWLVGIYSIFGWWNVVDKSNIYFTKWLQHNSGYNLVWTGQIGDKKFVDPKAWVDYKYKIASPDNSNIIWEMATMFAMASNRDKKLSDLQISVSPLLYISHKSLPIDYTSKFRKYMPWVDYMTNRNEFIRIQNWLNPIDSIIENGAWYIETPRDLIAVVHKDLPQERAINIYFWLIKLWAKPKFGWFISNGPIWIADVVNTTVKKAMQQTRYRKYKYNRIRPEEVAWLFEFRDTLTWEVKKRVDKNYFEYTTRPEIANSKVKYGTYLLPQAYPEGSPLHPDYPQWHSTFAVVVQAFINTMFDTEYMIPNYVADRWLLIQSGSISIWNATQLFVDNIAIGRDYAWVHFIQAWVNNQKPIYNLAKKEFDNYFK